MHGTCTHPPPPSPIHHHTHTHTHTHTCTHAHTHTHKIFKHKFTRTHTHARMHTHTSTHRQMHLSAGAFAILLMHVKHTYFEVCRGGRGGAEMFSPDPIIEKFQNGSGPTNQPFYHFRPPQLFTGRSKFSFEPGSGRFSARQSI